MAPGQTYPTQTIYTQPVAPQPPPPAPPPVQESSTNTTLLSETRQQTTEVRLELTKLTTKMDEMSSKVCLLRGPPGAAAYLLQLALRLLCGRLTRFVRKEPVGVR